MAAKKTVEPIKKYNVYIQALGVSPGDDAECVKKAFRKKIKIHHPDTAASPEAAAKAQTLIEAYEAFKKGVPKVEIKGRDKNSGLFYRAQKHRKGEYRVGRAVTSEELGRAAAKRVFDAVFKNRNSPLEDALGDLSEMLWGDMPETQVYGAHAAVREYRPSMNRGQQKSPAYIDIDIEEEAIGTTHHNPTSLEGSRHFFFEAEEILRDIVSHFENAGPRRFSRVWVREYLEALAQVQVRFRDVSKYHPAFAARALRRVRQIGELMAEIKNPA